MNMQMQSPYANHDEVWLLLPWYTNDSLMDHEKNLVKNHLRVCLTCRKELVTQQMLAKNLQHTPLVEISSAPSFERLMLRIQADDKQTQAIIRNNKNSSFTWSGWLDSFLDSITARRLTVAIASVLMILTLPYVLHEKPLTDLQQFHTVSNAGSLDEFTKNDIHVVFTDQLTKPQIEALVKPLHGYIVQGASTSRVYTIRINDAEQPDQSVALAIERLRANKSVLLAEPALPWKVEPAKKGG